MSGYTDIVNSYFSNYRSHQAEGEMTTKPCAGTYEFRVGKDADGNPCIDMFSRRRGRGPGLPIAYITREQLLAVIAMEQKPRETEST